MKQHWFMNPVVWKMFTYFSEAVGANHDKNNYELISTVYEMINCFHGYSCSQLLFLSLNKYLLRFHYILGIVRGARDILEKITIFYHILDDNSNKEIKVIVGGQV